MIADPSETSAADLAAGDVSGLCRPIYFAYGHEIERAQFLEMHALKPHEVLRVRHAYQIPSQCAPRKVLILAPRWGEDRATESFVAWWVECDRYTFAVELEPVPSDQVAEARSNLRWPASSPWVAPSPRSSTSSAAPIPSAGSPPPPVGLPSSSSPEKGSHERSRDH